MTYTIATGEACVWTPPSALCVTVVAGIDEQERYKQIEQQLVELERATMCDEEKLAALKQETNMLFQMDDERAELHVRIRWLQQLYNVAKEVERVKTSKDVERLQAVLTTLPPSPLKRTLEETLRQKQVTERGATSWLDDLIKQADPIFLNLGKEGRAAIMKRVEEERNLSSSLVLTYVREQAEQLEEKVRKLASIQHIDLLVEVLHELPFVRYTSLSDEKKRIVAEKLYERQPFWRGFQAVATEIATIVDEMRNNGVWGYVGEEQTLRRERTKGELIPYLVKQTDDHVLTFEK